MGPIALTERYRNAFRHACWAVLAICALGAAASARGLTPAERKAIAFLGEDASTADADALEKLLRMEAKEEIPLDKRFVDASIGRDSVRLLTRQIARLVAARAGRPALDRVIAALSNARGGLIRHGYLNWGPSISSPPSDRLVLDPERVDPRSFQRRAVAIATSADSDENARIARHFAALGLSVEPSRGQGAELIVTIPGKSKRTLVLAAVRGVDGSGAAALMEAGRALGAIGFEKTIRLVLVSKEIAGEADRLQRALAPPRGAPIDGVFVLGKIAAAARGDGATPVPLRSDRDTRSLYLGSELTRAAARLGRFDRGSTPTDLAPSEDRASLPAKLGVPTVLLGDVERSDADDARGAGQPDYARAGKIVRATLETVARLARPLPKAPALTRDGAEGLDPRSSFGVTLRKGQPEQNVGAIGRNELLDEHGAVRPPYLGLAHALQGQTQTAQAGRQGKMHALSGDDSVYRAYPRVVSGAEFATAERGLRQIERVMQATLADVYSADSKLLASGLLTRADLEIAEDFRSGWVGRSGRARFDLLVRPDLVRDAEGNWTLLEINQGYTGGMSGIRSTRELLRKASPEIFEAALVRPVEDFLGELAAGLKSMARTPGGKVVCAQFGAVRHRHDGEDQYLTDALQAEGIEYVSPYTKKQLKTIRGRVYLVSPAGSRERVEVVYSIKAGGPPEMEAAHLRGGVRMFPSPGSGVLESKHLYKKLPQLIRALLKEEPVFHFLKTRSFGSKDGTIDQAFLDEVMQHPERWVIKAANDAAGDGVLVGMGARAAALAAFKQKILDAPAAWDAQEFTAPETLNGERVDFDPFVLSTNGRVIIPKGAMVRSAPLDKRFSDRPHFLDAWVLDDHGPRDYLLRARKPKAARTPRARR